MEWLGSVKEINTLTSHFKSEFNSWVKGIEELEEGLEVRKRSILKAQYIIDVPVLADNMEEEGVP